MNTHKEPIRGHISWGECTESLSNCCCAPPVGEVAQDGSGRCKECKEGCTFEKFTEEEMEFLETHNRLVKEFKSGDIDMLGYIKGHQEANTKLIGYFTEPTPPSQIEEENTRFVESFESDDNDYDMLTIKQLKILERYHERQLNVIEGKLEEALKELGKE